MADVRLTAVNPEDSQVYPVACNDKGELLLDSGGATGDLEVTGNLTVQGDTTTEVIKSAGNIYSGVATKGQDSAGVRLFDTGNIQVHKTAADSSTTVFEIFKGGSNTPKTQLKSDGSASFSGRVDVTNQLFAAQSSPVGGNPGNSFVVKDTRLNKIASLIYTDGTQRIGGNLTGGWSTDAPNIALNSDGSASLSGQLTVDRNLGSGNNGACIRVEDGGSLVSRLNNDGSATFNGNVTAPNINFKLAPTTVAAMPAPLIDEGFAANDEVDLLSVIIEMKLQIRDLNAFMQRSIQDDPAT